MEFATYAVTAVLLLAGMHSSLAQIEHPDGFPHPPTSYRVDTSGLRRTLQQQAGYGAGLVTAARGLQASAGLLTKGYRTLQMGANAVSKMQASATLQEIAQQACEKDDIKDVDCVDALLLTLMPDSYSSNKTADSPFRKNYISPAQDQRSCSSCVGFTVTAAAEAAVNVFMRQNHNKLSLSEQDLSFCRLVPTVDCSRGASYESVITNVMKGDIKNWASRSCLPYQNDPGKTCPQPKACPSQLPKDGAFSMAYEGNSLKSMARIKEQIMLSGGVMTSIALTRAAFDRFTKYKTGVFNITTNLTTTDQIVMHAVFCYGWSNNPGTPGTGWWLCKNSWSPTWGMEGSFRIAYGAGYIMQPDYSFALRFQQSPLSRAAEIKRNLQPDLSWDATRPECLLYHPSIPARLAQLADDLAALAKVDSSNKLTVPDIMADIVPSNLGYWRGALSAAARGPFRLCGDTLLLLKDTVGPQPPPLSSPTPGGGGNTKICLPSRSPSPACKRCAKSITAGWGHTCVTLFDGSLECAGNNDFGQLADGRPGTTNSRLASTTAFTSAGIAVAAAAAGVGFTCVLSYTNKVYCVGQGKLGQLGHGKLESSPEPVAVQGLKSVRITQLVAGQNHAAVLYEDGSVQVWGSDDINRVMKTTKAVAVEGVSSASVLAAGFGQTCAILQDQNVVCFGGWQDPVIIPSVSKATRIAVRTGATEKEAGCAVVKVNATAPAFVACWGFSDLADMDFYRRVPLAGTPVDVVMGSEHACALVDDGPTSVWCWGMNSNGQLGQGSVSSDSDPAEKAPVRVSRLDGVGVSALSSGVQSMFALTVTGGAYAWGFNDDGGLATDRIGSVTEPVTMKNLCV